MAFNRPSRTTDRHNIEKKKKKKMRRESGAERGDLSLLIEFPTREREREREREEED